MRTSRLSVFQMLAAAIAACVPWSVSESLAQSYPVKEVRMIVGFSPGGGTDTAARLLAKGLSAAENLGQPVIIENRPGAGGAIAGELVAKSPADGYTLLMMASAATIQPALRAKLPYDVERDFAPVSFVGKTPFVLVVHPSVPVHDVKQLIALARSRPGELSYGTSGIAAPLISCPSFLTRWPT